MSELLTSSLGGSSDPELEGHAPGRKGVEALRFGLLWRKGDKDWESMGDEEMKGLEGRHTGWGRNDDKERGRYRVEWYSTPAT